VRREVTNYLCFCVSVKTNQFVYKQNDKYTPEQEELHNYIKSLQVSGMSYHRITKHLNDKGITTHRGNKWGIEVEQRNTEEEWDDAYKRRVVSVAVSRKKKVSQDAVRSVGEVSFRVKFL